METFVFAGKVLVVSGLLYGYYHLFLRDRHFHRFNRVYLLAASMLAVLVPFLNIPVHFSSGAAPVTALNSGLRVVSGAWLEEMGGAPMRGAAQDGSSGVSGWWLLYGGGVAVCMGLFLRGLIYIISVRRKYRYQAVGDVRLYDTHEQAAPFSFFRSIFWHEHIPFGSREGQQIFRHELYHARQGHSLDICWMELCCIVAWFNPFFHLMRKELKTIHEYLADEYAISANDPLDYAEMLVVRSIDRQRQAGIVGGGAARIGSRMFSPVIKRRVDMIMKAGIGQARIRQAGIRRRLMVLPVIAMVAGIFGFRVAPLDGGPVRRAEAPFTVVVDAGHGGVDPGATTDSGIEEKDLALQLTQTIDRLAPQYNITVILTRNSDILPGNTNDKNKGLENRVAITKGSAAKAFISIHVNNSGEQPEMQSGIDAYVSTGRSDDKGLRLANRLLDKLRGVYAAPRPVLQRTEHIYVLDHNVCPSVLLECGYINNPNDLRFIQSAANQEAIARAILQSLVDARAEL